MFMSPISGNLPLRSKSSSLEYQPALNSFSIESTTCGRDSTYCLAAIRHLAKKRCADLIGHCCKDNTEKFAFNPTSQQKSQIRDYANYYRRFYNLTVSKLSVLAKERDDCITQIDVIMERILKAPKTRKVRHQEEMEGLKHEVKADILEEYERRHKKHPNSTRAFVIPITKKSIVKLRILKENWGDSMLYSWMSTTNVNKVLPSQIRKDGFLTVAGDIDLNVEVAKGASKAIRKEESCVFLLPGISSFLVCISTDGKISKVAGNLPGMEKSQDAKAVEEFHMKICKVLCERFDYIFVPRIPIREIPTENGQVWANKCIHNKFMERLELTADSYSEPTFIKEIAFGRYPTICSRCGHIGHPYPEIHLFSCSYCGLKVDLDENLARSFLLKCIEPEIREIAEAAEKVARITTLLKKDT